MDETTVARLMVRELRNIRKEAPPFESIEQGLEVIQDHVDILEIEIDQPSVVIPKTALEQQVVKVAAQALRFLIDLC